MESRLEVDGDRVYIGEGSQFKPISTEVVGSLQIIN